MKYDLIRYNCYYECEKISFWSFLDKFCTQNDLIRYNGCDLISIEFVSRSSVATVMYFIATVRVKYFHFLFLFQDEFDCLYLLKI
jgi:hypothetical protein